MAAEPEEVPVGACTTRLAVDLYRALAGGDTNLVLSPSSIFSALAMTLAGAAGRTATQMADVLHVDTPDEELHAAAGRLNRSLTSCEEATGVVLEVANSLWPQHGEPLVPGFLELLQRHYGAPPQAVDFRKDPRGARETINAWVSDRTRHLIPELLAPRHIDHFTALVLVSAVYLAAPWRSPFDPARTRQAAFTCGDGRQVAVPMMTQTARLGYARRAGYQALELPYADEDLAMVVILPEVGRFAEVETRLDAPMLAKAIRSLHHREVVLSMPRLSLSSTIELGDVLKKLGMADAFRSRTANFSAMSEDNLWIGAVHHQAWVDVDERGTTAAAATAVVMTRSASAPPRMVLDRPFLFMVHHRPTGTPLFLGRVLDPATEPATPTGTAGTSSG